MIGIADTSALKTKIATGFSYSRYGHFDRNRRAQHDSELRRALEKKATVIFVEENGEGPGVRLRKARNGKPKSGRRQTTAFHEAGHAVVAHALGVRLYGATVVPAEGYAGQVEHESVLRRIRLDVDGSTRARLRVERAIKIGLAGAVAQQRHRPPSLRRWRTDGDYQSVAELALRVCGTEKIANAFIEWLRLETAALLDLRWHEVKAVAKALLEKHHLTGAEIDETIQALAWAPRKRSVIRVHEEGDDEPAADRLIRLI
jgi:hypothetical protein